MGKKKGIRPKDKPSHKRYNADERWNKHKQTQFKRKLKDLERHYPDRKYEIQDTTNKEGKEITVIRRTV